MRDGVALERKNETRDELEKKRLQPPRQTPAPEPQTTRGRRQVEAVASSGPHRRSHADHGIVTLASERRCLASNGIDAFRPSAATPHNSEGAAVQ